MGREDKQPAVYYSWSKGDTSSFKQQLLSEWGGGCSECSLCHYIIYRTESAW